MKGTVSYVASTLAKSSHLRNLSNTVSLNVTKTAYYAVFHSHIAYAIIAWVTALTLVASSVYRGKQLGSSLGLDWVLETIAEMLLGTWGYNCAVLLYSPKCSIYQKEPSSI